MDEQNPRKRKTPASPLLDHGDHLSSPTSKPDDLPLPSPTSTLPLIPEHPPPSATPTDDQLSLHESSDLKNDTIDQNTSLSSSTSEPPPLPPSSPSSSTLPLLPEHPPSAATPTDQLSSHESSDIKNDNIDQNTSLSSSTSGPPPLPPSSSTLPLLPEIPPPPPSVTPTTDHQHESFDTIDPPYPWATNRRATVHSLEYLTKNGIKKIEGEVQCKKCNKKYKRVFDLEERFKKIADFMKTPLNTKDIARERALHQWLTPDLGVCDKCGKRGRMNPVFPEVNSGQEINWLFLFLGHMLEFCCMEQLKYFCYHNKVRRLGAQDRLIYLAHVGLCKQLDPNSAPFDPC